MKTFVRILTLALAAALLCGMLVSCAPANDPAKAEKALEEEDYTVVSDDTVIPALYKLAGYDLDKVVTGTKIVEDKEGYGKIDVVVIYYFADKEDAEKAMDDIKKDAEDIKEDENTDWVEPTRSGKIVYFGTKAAVKAVCRF